MLSLLTVSATLALAQGTPCPRGWEPLGAGDACLLRGDAPGLIVYFHGMMAPSPKPLAWELSFISTATAKAKRVPVVALRGTPGLCDWADEYREWWCWPSVRSRLPEVGTALTRLGEALVAAGAALKRHLPAPLLVGYSNGGYFLSLVMGDTKLRASGYVVLHGGQVTGVAFPPERKRPTLLVAATDDQVQRPAMESFRATLDAAGWAPGFFLRKGSHPPEVEDFTRVLDFASRLEWESAE